MSLFGTEITREQVVDAQMQAIELQSMTVRTSEQEKALQAANKLIAGYQKQAADMEANLKLGLKAALKVLKTFLPKKISQSIPDNAVDMLFGLIHKPEIILDYCNKQWQDFCDDLGIPAECVRIMQQKPGPTADLEGIIGVYNPHLGYWIYTEYNMRDLIEKVRPGGTVSDNAASLKDRIREAYNRKTDPKQLNKPNV